MVSSAVNIGMLRMRPRRKRSKGEKGEKTSSDVSPASIGNSTSAGDLEAAVIDTQWDVSFCQPCSPPRQVAIKVETKSTPAKEMKDEDLTQQVDEGVSDDFSLH